jgi:hypothetical protein
MKNIRIMFSAIAVIAIVSSSLAFKSFNKRNLLICDSNHFCAAQTTATSYSDTPGTLVTNPPTLYKPTGTIGASCGSIQCPQYMGQVFVNQ